MSTNRRARWGSFEHPRCDVEASVEARVPFVRRIDAWFPGASKSTPTTSTTGVFDEPGATPTKSWRHEAMMSIADALDPHFVHEHVRRLVERVESKGDGGEAKRNGAKKRISGGAFGMKTVAASANAAESMDVWCVTPNGRFVASLMQEGKETLGLPCVTDAYGKAGASVNLTRREFAVSNRFHDRIGECARTLEMSTGKTPVVCAFEVDGERQEVTFPKGATNARRVDNVKTFCVIEADLEGNNAKILQSLEPPKRGESKEVNVDDFERVLDWCGRVSLGIVNGKSSPSESAIEMHRWEGFMLCTDVMRVIQTARKLLSDDENAPPWVIVTAWGFPDVPDNLSGATVKKRERVACSPIVGEVFHIVLFPSGSYLSFVGP